MLEKQYYEIALKLYKKLYRDYPKQQDIQFSLAYIYHKLNRFEQAKKLYYKLINSSNKEIKSKSINNILIIVANQPNSNVDFILKKLSAENSENPYITSHLAIYYHERNKLNEAILLMRKAYNLQPSEISHKINLAILYDRNQQYKRASSIYQQIVDDYSQNKLSGDNIDIFKIKNRLEFIRKL